MPFRDTNAGGFLPVEQEARLADGPEDSTLSDVAKIGTVAGIGAGLLLAPLPTLGVMAAAGGGSLLADREGADAAFRTENTIGSYRADKSGKYTGSSDPDYDPWDDIGGTEFEPYWENFAGARNAEHADIIRQDIIRERKDREYLDSQGMLGFAQSMAAGMFDLPSLLPGGAVVRTAKGASRLRTGLKVGAFGTASAGIAEGVLQGTQELRTPEESAMNIAGATILSGVLGYGMASRMNSAEMSALGKRVERDFTPPDRSKATPSTDPQPSIPREMDALETELRQVHELINPHDDSVALQLQDELIRIDPERVTRGELYAIEDDDGGDFGIPARRGLSGAGERDAGAGEVPSGERPVTGAVAGESGATAKGGPKAVTGTETFPLEGFTGVRTAEVPASGKIAARVYRVYPEGVKVNRLKSPVKSLGEPLGEVRISQHEDGRWEVGNVEIGEGIRRQKVATRLYDQIESDLGIKMRPSGHLEPNGFEFWKNRNSEAVKHHRYSTLNGQYLSPRQIKGQLEFVQSEIAKGIDEPTHRARWLRERDELQSLWDELPAEVKTKPALDSMFSLRGEGVTQTPAFKRWFGSSKVVDENGRPLVVYHGTRQDIESFDLEAAARESGEPDVAFFLSNSSDLASDYAVPFPGAEGGNVIPAYVKMNNPLYVEQPTWGYRSENAELIEQAKADGHDGIIFTFTEENPVGDAPLREYVVFNPEQIKSAIGNRGTFDPTDPRIAFSLRGFYSPAIRAAENISQAKGTGEQFYKQITKVPGVRKDELEWMGLEEFLADKKSITKDEVLAFMRAHQVELDEKVLGDTITAKKELAPITVEEALSKVKWSEDWFEQADKIWSYRIGDEQYYITQGEAGDEGFGIHTADGQVMEGEPANLAQAQHMLEGHHASMHDDEGLTRFADHKVPGGTDYREILIRLPQIGKRRLTAAQRERLVAIEQEQKDLQPQINEARFGSPERKQMVDKGSKLVAEQEAIMRATEPYTSRHFYDSEIVHLRVDDRLINLPEPDNAADIRARLLDLDVTDPEAKALTRELHPAQKVLFINEIQSDLLQTARRFGFGKEGYAKAKAAEVSADSEKVRIAATKYIDTFGEKGAPKVPFTNDTAVEIALKRALLYAAENGYDAVSWARSDQAAKAVGADQADLALQYDKNMGRFLDRYTRKWGGKVEEAPIVEQVKASDRLEAELRAAAEDPDAPGIVRSLLRRVDEGDDVNRLVASLTSAERQEIRPYLSTEDGINSLYDRKTVKDQTNPLLRITPEMRASVMEGQPLAMRRNQQGELVAEAKFEREKMLITISRAALDPVNNVHHEAVHALKARGLFRPTEWRLIEASAKSKGWLDNPLIKDYQKIYGRSLEDESIIEEAFALAYQRHVKGDEIQKGALAKIFDRITAYLERISNYIRGRGPQTIEDLFRAIEQGDIGARAAPERRTDATSTGFTAAGAQTSQQGDVRLKGALGTEKALAFLSPAMRLQNSPSRAARSWVNELAETALTYEDHKSWIVTARGGAELGQPGSVETRVKLYDTNIAAGFKALDNLFIKYRKGSARRIPGDLTVTSLRDATAGPPADKMDYRRFREAVSAAMRRGDEHDIPEVAEAAKVLRKEVFDPLLQRAIDLELLPEDVTPETAASYLNRIYNKERIVAERTEFRDVITKWFQETELSNGKVRGQIIRHLDEFKTNQGKLKALSQKIERRQQRLAEMERAGEEVSRFNKFATERSIKMSEPIDDIRTEIDAITSKIEEQLARIQELSGEIRTQKENIPGLQDVERQMQSLSRALSDFRKRTEFIEQIEDAGDIEESLGELATSFQDTLGRLRSEGRELRAGGVAEERLPSGMTQEQMIYQASQETTGDSLRIMLEDYSQGGVVKKHFPSGEKREVLDRMAGDVREILAGIETGDRARSVRAIGNALIEADALEGLHPGPEARLFTQWVRTAARNHQIEAAAEQRIPYPETSGEDGLSEAGQILKALERERARLSKRISPFRKQLRALRTDQKTLERRARPRAAEGNVYRTRIAGRVNTLQDQISSRRGELESLTFEQTNRTARQNELSKLVEEQIGLYQGKTADEAKSALKSRGKTEEGRDADADRLASADKAVMKAARQIAAQTEKETIELVDTAEQIIDRILGTPEGRLPYDAGMNKAPNRNFGGVDMDTRGPLAARQFMIPDARIEQWLENDIDLLMRAYVHTMAPDVELTARFGSPDMVMQFKQINEEYARMAAATDDPQIRKRLHDQKKEDFLNLGAIRDRLRGTYALPENPDAITVRAIRGMMTLNYMRMLGGMTISALPDVSRFIHVHGVMGTFGDGIIPMFRSFSKYKKAGDETKWLSGALEMVTDNRAMRIADITDTFGRHTKFERGLQAAGRNFGMVSLMAPWNSVMKQLAGTVTQTRILRGAEKLFAGKPLKQKEIEYFADLGISEGALRQIGEQFKKHGHKESNVWSANTAQWDEGMRPAIEALRVGLRKEVDRLIITPSLGERPRFASTLWGSMLLQFKSFAISATQKMLISGLQQKDLNALNGAAIAIALGGMVHILKGELSGRPVEIDWSNDEEVKQFLGNAFDRSGMAGVLMEANNAAEKVTDGRLGLSALTGKPISRYASRNVTASLLGPAFGMAEDSFDALNAALGTREWKERDTHNTRQLLPYGNLFYLRSIFDNAEKGINEALGVPAR